MATGNVIGTFFEKEEGRTYEVNEGNVSIDTGYSTINGAKQKFFKFQYPVGAENFLQFDLGSGKDLQVTKATTKATHITMYDPEFPSGAFPTSAVNGRTVAFPVFCVTNSIVLFSQWRFSNFNPQISEALIPNCAAINTMA